MIGSLNEPTATDFSSARLVRLEEDGSSWSQRLAQAKPAKSAKPHAIVGAHVLSKSSNLQNDSGKLGDAAGKEGAKIATANTDGSVSFLLGSTLPGRTREVRRDSSVSSENRTLAPRQSLTDHQVRHITAWSPTRRFSTGFSMALPQAPLGSVMPSPRSQFRSAERRCQSPGFYVTSSMTPSRPSPSTGSSMSLGPAAPHPLQSPQTSHRQVLTTRSYTVRAATPISTPWTSTSPLSHRQFRPSWVSSALSAYGINNAMTSHEPACQIFRKNGQSICAARKPNTSQAIVWTKRRHMAAVDSRQL